MGIAQMSISRIRFEYTVGKESGIGTNARMPLSYIGYELRVEQ